MLSIPRHKNINNMRLSRIGTPHGSPRCLTTPLTPLSKGYSKNCAAHGRLRGKARWMLHHAQGHDQPGRSLWWRCCTSAPRRHARGGASAMAHPHVPLTPPASTRERMRRRACPCTWGTPSLLSHGHDSAGKAWGAGVSIQHADRPAAQATPWCRSGETRRLTRSLSHTTRPPRTARAGLPDSARTRVSVATDTVPPSQDYRIRIGDGDATFAQQLLHIVVAQGKPLVEPDTVANNFARQAVVFVSLGIGWRCHAWLPILLFD